MARWGVVIRWACLAMGCASAPPPKSPSTSTEPVNSSAGRAQRPEPASEVSQWSEVPQNEPLNQRSVIGKRKAQVIVVSNPSSHGEALHFQFVVNSVAISGVFSAPGGQTSTFTLPTGQVQFTLDECKAGPDYFELAPDTRVTLNCEMTTDGECCEMPDADEQKH